MTKFYLDAKIREVNNYEFTVEAETPEEAEQKLKEFLSKSVPHLFHKDPESGISCDDRESGIYTEEVISVTVV